MVSWQGFGNSKQDRYLLPEYYIRCLNLYHAVPCLTNVNINASLTHFFGFCKVTVSEKACPVIPRFDISHTCTNDTNSTDFFACLVINPITVDDYAALFNCTPVDRASDSMMAPT